MRREARKVVNFSRLYMDGQGMVFQRKSTDARVGLSQLCVRSALVTIMKRPSARLLPAVLLAVCLAGVWFWGGARQAEMTGPSPQAAEAGVPPPSPAPVNPKVARLFDPSRPEARDRFAAAGVLAEKLHETRLGGREVARRTRLVRDASFKYPLIRLEEELVMGAGGWRLARQRAMVADHLMVKPLDPEMPESELLDRLGIPGATVRRKQPASGVWLVAFPLAGLETVPEALAKFAGLRGVVRHAEPDYIVHAGTTNYPNDSSFSELWGMDNTGQTGGVPDADIDAPEAWAMHTGTHAVVAAVIDSGMDLNHPDLLPNLWTNPGEIPGNGIDDDGNGYVDDVHGWNFVNNTGNPQDDNGHGTHCAGTIGAAGNNSDGVAGVCWQVSLMPLKFLNSAGNGTLSDAVEAVAYSTMMGVTLSSNSWGGGGFSQTLLDEIVAADQAGILFVAAAGNAALDMDVTPDYPGAYNVPNLVTVAATTSSDGLSSFSNFGLTTTHLGAPGSDIYSTIPGGYGLNSGTSMAAPHVSGVCALLKSFKPALGHHQIRELVLATVDPIPALQGRTVTGGRLNAHSALLASSDVLLSPSQNWTVRGPVGGPFTPGEQVFTLSNQSPDTAGWSFSVNRSWVTLSSTEGVLQAGESATITATLNEQSTGLLAGTHAATFSLLNSTTGHAQTRVMQVRVNPPALYAFDLETDPGWAREGQWQHGTPQGQGGLNFGHPDPASGASGQGVLGINLAGDYNVSPGGSEYLTAGPFDFTGMKDASVRFRRWLNTDHLPWVEAGIQVSNDGVFWAALWDNGTEPLMDGQWTQIEQDLSLMADGQAQVYVRWKHQVHASGAYPYSGWNLDDIEILAVPAVQLRMTLPESVEEGGPPVTARVTALPVLESDLVISIGSDRPGEKLSLPESVVIPAGQEYAEFQITPLQDDLVDGTQHVGITASAEGYPDHAAVLKVHDDEQGVLALLVPATVTEGAGVLPGAGAVTLDAPADADIHVGLGSDRPGKIAVPAGVVIPLGQTQAVFDLEVLDDTVIEGTQPVQITATVVNWPPASGTVSVLDNEPLNLTVSLPAMRLESAGTLAGAGQVSVAGTLAFALEVTLSSGNPDKLLVPAGVTIPAGHSGAGFDLQFLDNLDADGPVVVTVTASASGFEEGAGQMIVADDETPALPAFPNPADGQASVQPDTDLAWAYDPHSGGAPDSYEVYFSTGAGPPVFLGLVDDPAWELPRLNPETSFQWQVVSRLGELAREGPVWTFTTPPIGPLHQFAWDPLPEAVIRGAPFPVRITAMDENGYEIPGFTGQARIEAQGSQPESETGTGIFPWHFPLATYYHDARTQSIYKPSEAGAAGRLSALALEVSLTPPQTMRNFTIRLKHTAKQNYVSGGNTWEGSGWTVVHTSDAVITAGGWHWFEFDTPFDYDGASNLMVDISFNNTSYTAHGTTLTTITPDYRTRAFLTDSQYGDPLNWSGSFPSASAYNGLPNLRLRRQDALVELAPGLTDAFTLGAWSAPVTAQNSGMNVMLKAALPEDESIQGLSTPLQIVAVNDFRLEPEPLFTGGLANTVGGAALGHGYEYEFEFSTDPEFQNAISTGFGAAPQHLYTGLEDGLLYHYRARARAAGLTGQWSPPERSTQDATPPEITFSPASGGITLQGDMLLSGGASDDLGGVSSLTVGGQFASTSDNYDTWSRHVALPGEGVNTFEITAADTAVPPNIRTETWSITRISSTSADSDGNGVSDLLDYAFHAGGGDAATSLPAASVAQDENGACLLLAYHRLIHNPSGLIYLIETSSDLLRWDEPVENPEIIGVTPDANGVTETVVVRIRPAAGEDGRAFARVRVILP